MQIKGLKHNFLGLTGFLFLLTGCADVIQIKGFDQVAWQKDSRSCGNIRPALLPGLQSAFPQLMGLTHTQVIQVLGKPEGNSLEKSGERVYYYFVQPGAQCNKVPGKNGNRLLVRFDALDRVYKVRLENFI